jgi:hypothetical protein
LARGALARSAREMAECRGTPLFHKAWHGTTATLSFWHVRECGSAGRGIGLKLRCLAGASVEACQCSRESRHVGRVSKPCQRMGRYATKHRRAELRSIFTDFMLVLYTSINANLAVACCLDSTTPASTSTYVSPCSRNYTTLRLLIICRLHL